MFSDRNSFARSSPLTLVIEYIHECRVTYMYSSQKRPGLVKQREINYITLQIS